MSGPADEHRRIAAAFTATVGGTPPESWDLPAPVEGWVARDVVRHLVEWFPAFLDAAVATTLPTGPSVDDDPVGGRAAGSSMGVRCADERRSTARCGDNSENRDASAKSRDR